MSIDFRVAVPDESSGRAIAESERRWLRDLIA
jgi:hypothetical protein